MLLDLHNCRLCPRACGVDRLAGERGWCRTGPAAEVASVCLHRGEEPVLGGGAVCNLFFARCNLACRFCQNRQISDLHAPIPLLAPDKVIEKVIAILSRGVDTLGFVSPTHQIPAMLELVTTVRERGFSPTIVYNSNGYDTPEVLATLEETVDIYLPDFKYADETLARNASDAPGYPAIALRALREMFRQKGRRLELDDAGRARRGVIVRHLILPGETANSVAALTLLAEEFGTGIAVSLMSQYHPAVPGLPEPLDRTLTGEEFAAVRERFLSLGFVNGWVQEPESHACFLPDFRREHPFEEF